MIDCKAKFYKQKKVEIKFLGKKNYLRLEMSRFETTIKSVWNE